MEDYCRLPSYDQNHMFFPIPSSKPVYPSSFSQKLSCDSFTTPGFHQSPFGFSGSKQEVPTSYIDHQKTLESSELIINNGSAGENTEEKTGKTKKGERKAKRPRYAFQTRSQVDILDDGYRWRKYGQKAVKNNKFPRSYYRCTHQSCNVKKQVQRLSKDESVVVTTYEGIHTHPIEKRTDNFHNILSQMHIVADF